MSIQALLIDAGGIILDESLLEDAFRKGIVDAFHLCEYQYQSERYSHDYEEGIIRFCPKSTHYVIWKNTEGDMKQFNRVLGTFREIFTHPPLQLMDGIEEQLRLLAPKYKLVLAGQYGSELYDLLDRHELSGLFANRLSQDDFSLSKPDPRYFLQIAQRSEVAPEECLMIGDRIDKDVVPARMAGMKTLLVKSSIYRVQMPRIPDECPDMTIDSITDLAHAVDELSSL